MKCLSLPSSHGVDPVLLRHLLGLKFGIPVKKTRLIYLYFESLGDEAAEHRQEIRMLCELLASDPVTFTPVSVQDSILRAVARVRDEHQPYADYLTEPYL
jgi:hypothetical protein